MWQCPLFARPLPGPLIPFPSGQDLPTYLRPLQQCMTTDKHPAGSRAGASPPTAYLTTLLVPLGSQHHQKASASSSSDAAGKQAMEEENWVVAPGIPWVGALGGGLPGIGVFFGSGYPLSTFLCSAPSPASPMADKA